MCLWRAMLSASSGPTSYAWKAPPSGPLSPFFHTLICARIPKSGPLLSCGVILFSLLFLSLLLVRLLTRLYLRPPDYLLDFEYRAKRPPHPAHHRNGVLPSMPD